MTRGSGRFWLVLAVGAGTALSAVAWVLPAEWRIGLVGLTVAVLVGGYATVVRRRANVIAASSAVLAAEIVDRKRAEDALQAALARTQRQLDAIGMVSQSEELLSGEIESLARKITELAARTIGCERVNLWLFDEGEVVLRCLDLYEATPARHSAGLVLEEKHYRREFEAFKAGRFVAADDPLTDPRTAGYVEGYLRPLKITSMLDTVIQMSGKNLGLLCFEHVAKQHHWEPDEIRFANQLADKFGIALVSRLRRQAEQAVQASETRFRTIYNSVSDAIFAHELETGRILDVNQRVVELYGYTREQFLSGDVGMISSGEAPYTQDDALARLAAARAGDTPPFDWHCRTRDGQLFWGEVTLRRASFGATEVILATVRNITERRQAQDRLRESEEKFRGLVESSSDFIWEIDAAGRYTYVGPKVRDLLGYECSELLGRLPFEFMSPAEAARVAAIFAPVEKARKTISMLENRVLSRSGNEVILETSAVPWFDAEGRYQGYRGIDRDVTRRKRAEDEFRKSQQLLESILNAIPVRVFWKNKDLVFLGCNRAFAQDAGFEDPGELVGKDDYQMGWRAQADLYRQDDRLVIGSGQPKRFIEEPQTTPDGKTITLLTTKVPLRGPGGEIDGILGIYMDITERKRAEEKIRRSEAELSEAQRLAKLGSWTWHPRTGLVTWSDELYRIVGRDPMLPAPSLPEHEAILTPASYRAISGMLQQVLKAETSFVLDLEFFRPDGGTGWMLARGEVEHDAAGTVLFVRGTALDITERKQAEEALAYRDRIQHAVAVGTTEAVAGESLEHGMARALKTVGKALHADRAIVMEYVPLQETPILRYVWQRPGVIQLDQEGLRRTKRHGSEAEQEWLAPLRDGKAVMAYRQSASAPVRRLMEQVGNQATLIVPISVAGMPWGMIEVDSCRPRREWLAAEIETVRTFAEVIGAVITKHGMQVSLRRSEERFRAVSETAQDAIIMVDTDGIVEFWNPAAERTLGFLSAEVLGRDIHEFLAPERYRRRSRSGLAAFAASGQGPILGRTMELSALRKDGVEIPIELSVAGLKLGEKRHAVAILRDISDRKRVEAQIVRLARYDSLTGLANRDVFVEALQQAIARARRGSLGFAVLYLDLDHFKDVNDTLGHPVGDMLLKEVGHRLRTIVRETDTVARFGGDEFGIIQSDIAQPEDAAVLSAKLLRAIGEPFSIGESEIRTGTSVGIAAYGTDSPEAEAVLSHADVALYRAKAEGRGTYRFFTESMDAEVRARVTISAELRAALQSGQLFLMYQPQVDAATGDIVGIEALARWRHPTRGIVLPAEFIPIAEKSGLIVALGHWVMHEACRQAKAWLDEGIALPLIAVNLSALQFKTPQDLERDINGILAETGLPTSKLELELTESALMEASREHNDVLLRLRRNKLRLAIDDFGTGYSSLDYLRRFPVDRIKIAQEFIADLTEGSSDAPIVRAAIGLARELNLQVIVEGVETDQQLTLVRSWGAQQVQGFYFSPPLAADAAATVLRAGRTALPVKAAVGQPAPAVPA